jgi:O-antigen/teichoic acid export membrane protein
MLGDMFRYSVSLVMLPIYTRYLTPADYGTVELLTMVIDFAAILFGARTGQSVFRFFCTAENTAEKNSIISSAMLLGVLSNGIGAAAIAALAGPLAILVFQESHYSTYITLLAVNLFLLPLTEIPLVHIRAQQKPWLFFIFSCMKLAIQVALNIYFVVLQELHVDGVIYSAVLSSAAMAVLLTSYSLYSAGIRVRLAMCRELFSFGLPLKLAAVGSFYLTFGDRYILNMYSDLSQVGLYALGYKFGFIFTLIAWTPFQKMWDAEKYTIYSKPNAIHIYQKVFLYTSSILILFGLTISLFARDLLRIMSDPAFWDAYKVVPIIIIAYTIQAWTRYCNMGILLEKKTMQIAHAEIIAVIAITAAYFALIPPFGIHGAAWATVIGFAVRFFWTNAKSTQLYDMRLPWWKVGLASLLAIATYGLSWLAPEQFIGSIVVRIALLLLFLTAFALLPILSADEKEEIRNLVLRRQRRISIN